MHHINMNSICLEFKLNQLKYAQINDDTVYDNDYYSINISRLKNSIYSKKEHYFNKETKTTVFVLGYISNMDEINAMNNTGFDKDVAAIEFMYSIKSTSFIEYVDGIYLAYIFDEKIKKGYIIQSAYGFNLPVYYTTTKSAVIISSSLKQILKYIPPKDRKFNLRAVDGFLTRFNSEFFSKITLISKVYKLMPDTYMKADYNKNKYNIKKINIRRKKIALDKAKKELIPSIRNTVHNLAKTLDKNNICQTITGGWDGAFIMYLLKSFSPSKIKAIVIDGGESVSEVDVARYMNERLNDSELIVGKITTDIINSLPSIVWIYEGYVFQEGMFLRYVLADLLKKEKADYVYLGTCADQILYWLPKGKRLRFILNRLIELALNITWGTKFFSLNKFQYPVAANGYIGKLRNIVDFSFHRMDFNLKMHEIMMNNFGIQGIYPFVNHATSMNSKNLGQLGYKKAYYIECVKKLIGYSTAKKVKKSENVVDTEAFFFYNKPLTNKVFEKKIIKKILSDQELKEIKKNQNNHHLLILKLAYLYVFDLLFLSGDYDNSFDENKAQIKLTDIL